MTSRLNDLQRLEAFIKQEIARERARREPDTADLIGMVAELYEVPEDFLSDSSLKGRTITHARFAVCWLLRQRGLSTTHIGRIVDRDHTSVMYATRAIDNDPARVAILRQLVDDGDDTPGGLLRQIVRAS